MSRAVFLDRDGTVIADSHYVIRPEQIRVYAGSARALRLLKKAGFKVIIISNQSAVARGMISKAGLAALDRVFRRRLRERLDGVFYCLHQPSDRCACRKPGIGLVLQAKRKFKIDLKASYFVGDKTVDLLAAKRAGCTGVLVKTGKGGRDGLHKVKPAAVCRGIAAAARWIVRDSQRRLGQLT